MESKDKVNGFDEENDASMQEVLLSCNWHKSL